MINFKDYLSEKSSQSSTKISFQIAHSAIPLTTTMMKRLDLVNEKRVFHATNMGHLKNLAKTGKSKKQISTFTTGVGSILSNIVVMPDVVAVLEGQAILGATSDFYTSLDEKGRRWFGVSESPAHSNAKKNKFFNDGIRSKVFNKLVEMGTLVEDDRDWIMNELGYHGELNNVIQEMESKDRNKLYKWYFDMIEQYLSKDMYMNIMLDYLDATDAYKHDEIVMNKFKVLGVYSIENGKYKYDHSMAQYDIEKLGYKYLGHITPDKYNKIDPYKI